MNKLLLHIISFSFLYGAVCALAGAQSTPAPVLLWPGPAPGATGESDEDKPAIYPYLADSEKKSGAAMLVVPGGGFMTRVTDQEGVLIAQWFRSRGIAAFILRYRIRPIGDMAQSIQDAQRGMQFLRAHAAEYRIAPNRIGMIGFSAGAELIHAMALRPSIGATESTDPVERMPTQPNFIVLAYGSTSAQPSADAAAPFPPTFMFCTAEDAGHINGMLTLYNNLRRLRVPVEAHFFANGEHGVGFAHGDPVLGEWPDLMFNWIRAGGFLTDQPRVAVRGLVKLDDQPLARGVVIFTPIDLIGAPPIAAYVMNTGPVRGEFNLPQAQGPIPGKYRVDVHQFATRWMSNSVDPFIVGMTQKQRSGLSDQDRQAWLDFARARDLSPSIENERVYRKQHPTDSQEIIIEIKSSENRIDLQVFNK